MTISIVDLRTLLTSNLGSQYELKGSDFGAASSELFTKYIPGGSLAITAPAPDADALTLGGSARISSLTQPVGLLVKFLPDAQNATVAGMTLTFDLPGWSFEADFASFQGSALGVMGFADPKLILAASAPGASGTTCSASIGGTRTIDSQKGKQSAQLLAAIPDMDLVKQGLASNYVFQVDLTGVTLGDLNGLAQFVTGANFNLPSDIPVADLFDLTHLEFVLDPVGNQVVSFGAMVSSNKGLTLLEEPCLEIASFWFSFMIIAPRSSTQVYVVAGTTLDLFGHNIDLVMDIDLSQQTPDLYLEGSLHHETPVQLKPFIEQFIQPVDFIPDNFQISELDFGIGFRKSPPYVFEISLENLWKVDIGSQQLEVKSLSVMLSSSGSGPLDLAVLGQVGFAGDIFYLSFTREDPNWKIAGGTVGAAGTYLPDGTKLRGLEVGKLIDELGKSFDLSVPEPLKSLDLKDIQTSFVTGTNAFTFDCAGEFTVEEVPVQLVIQVDIQPKIAGGGYDGTFTGQLTVGELQFTVKFDHKDLTSDIFVATYAPKDGDPEMYDLSDLVSKLSPTLAEAIPAGITIGLKDVKFVFSKKAAGNNFAFGLDLSVSISLTDLPVVGDKLPPGLSLEVKDLQAVYSKAKFIKDDLAPINQLLPSNVIPFPAAGMSQGVNLAADIQLGSEQVHLALGVPQAKTGTDLQATGGPAATNALAPSNASGASSSELVKWIDVNKQFGIFQFDRIGAGYQNNILSFALDAGVTLGPLTLSLDGLSVGSSLTKFEPDFSLNGLGLAFKNPTLELLGYFLKVIDESGASYYGEVVVKAAKFNLLAVGGWEPDADPSSFFIYANLDAPLGGPPFLFITGLAGGLGINRAIKLPTIDTLPGFILLPQNAPPQPEGPPSATIQKVLPQLKGSFPVQAGQYWLAAGVQFTTFEMVESFALLIVSFGVDLQIAILGSSSATIPAPDEPDPIAYLEIDLIASFTPATGLLAVDGRLSPASYIFGGFVKLTGGFAFYAWFSGEHQGNFVLTLGGYHPAFQKPSYFPDVPRLSMNFALGPLQVTGSSYFALTSSMLMAGLRMEALWNSGPVKAWLAAGVDFLIGWAPFHYEADAYITLGCSIDMGLYTLNLHIGADLTIWGPPFGGRCHVDLDVISFTIYFGADQTPPPPIGWATFKGKFLPADTAGKPDTPELASNEVHAFSAAAGMEIPSSSSNIIKASPAGGLLGSDVDGYDWILDPDHFNLQTSSAIPANHAEWAMSDRTTASLPNTKSSYQSHQVDVTAGPYLALPSDAKTRSDSLVWNPDLHIGPMDQENIQSYHVIRVCRRTESDSVDTFSEYVTDLSVTPVLLSSSTALWGPSKKNADKTPNDPLLVEAALTGFSITPIPRKPAQVKDLPLINLLYVQGHSTGFNFQQAGEDTDFAVTSSIDPAGQLLIGIAGKHSAQIPNQGYILKALVDPWIVQQRASILDDLAANGFSTYGPAEVDLRALATEKALTDWPAVANMGSCPAPQLSPRRPRKRL